MGIACIASVSARFRLKTLQWVWKWRSGWLILSLNNEKNLNSFKKSIERFKIIRWFVKVDRNVYKTANKSVSIHTNPSFDSSNQAEAELSPRSFTHVFKKTKTIIRWNCRTKALRFLRITAKNQDFPFLTVFLIIKTSLQNISITLLRFCLNFINIEATVLEKKAPVNDFVRFPCRESLLK